MKIYDKPVVHLVASTQMHHEAIDDFLDGHQTHMPAEWCVEASDGDQGPELAGRLCYMAFGDKAGRKGAEYLKHILEVGHGSVLEHTNISIIAEGISRTCTHEWVRHRVGQGYSQLSQRYVDSSEAALVIHPAAMDDPTGEVRQALVDSFEKAVVLYEQLTKKLADAYLAPETLFKIAIDQKVIYESDKGQYDVYSVPGFAKDGYAYKELLSLLIKDTDNLELRKHIVKKTRTSRRKMARECAREVLPNSTETKMYVTGNMRAWRHFFGMRGNANADRQIRRVAVEVFRKMQEHVPFCLQDITAKETADGIGCLVVQNNKV